ncbi:hypothetical protein SAMN05192533_101496 [Mesobacillus persicus]|uniref:Uncharacterized protein n=1 Tax=Mesobacillus persicus TaxID=930146 RepID=A0A1H7WLY2_9BACI|nr:hypothetical protein [Mesobacillus persicus]SEM22576.1 hypothetical protein SAMN05192533_101496 [Mesobacillus persicus]
MTENHQFEAMKSNWDSLAMGDFYELLAAKLDFVEATNLNHVKEKVIEVVGEENESKVSDSVLPAILVTAFYYKTGKETVILSKEESKDILSMEEPYIDVEYLSSTNFCLYLRIDDGLLTATDQAGKILEVEGIYLLNVQKEPQNALLAYSVVKDEGKYGFHYLSFPYGEEGNIFDYYEAFSEAIGLEENAFQSREILQFALNAIYYLDF